MCESLTNELTHLRINEFKTLLPRHDEFDRRLIHVEYAEEIYSLGKMLDIDGVVTSTAHHAQHLPTISRQEGYGAISFTTDDDSVEGGVGKEADRLSESIDFINPHAVGHPLEQGCEEGVGNNNNPAGIFGRIGVVPTDELPVATLGRSIG